MTLKLMRELEIRLRMQKRYRKPKTVVTVDQKSLIVHSDMGSQYTCAEFNIKCQNYGFKNSYSLKGHPYDNDCMEVLHSILKREKFYLKVQQTLTEVEAGISWTINSFNRNRISNVA